MTQIRVRSPYMLPARVHRSDLATSLRQIRSIFETPLNPKKSAWRAPLVALHSAAHLEPPIQVRRSLHPLFFSFPPGLEGLRGICHVPPCDEDVALQSEYLFLDRFDGLRNDCDAL
jgi:hypothetical protein